MEDEQTATSSGGNGHAASRRSGGTAALRRSLTLVRFASPPLASSRCKGRKVIHTHKRSAAAFTVGVILIHSATPPPQAPRWHIAWGILIVSIFYGDINKSI
ncbi:hypothetical protein C2W62_36040 [Candidatus Entotheonella serta]|nr:hypothetical protein C2W62_36040 [Candidatus Entotheonella serta]